MELRQVSLKSGDMRKIEIGGRIHNVPRRFFKSVNCKQENQEDGR